MNLEKSFIWLYFSGGLLQTLSALQIRPNINDVLEIEFLVTEKPNQEYRLTISKIGATRRGATKSAAKKTINWQSLSIYPTADGVQVRYQNRLISRNRFNNEIGRNYTQTLSALPHENRLVWD